MTRSMTAFARGEEGAVVWEIRSVNHRYLDVSFRMPDSFRHLETSLKSTFKDRISRGKIECSLKLETAELPNRLTVNEHLLAELKEAVGRVSSITGIENQGDALGLLRFPDVLVTEDASDTLSGDVVSAFNAAVDQLVEMREREGRELGNLIEQRLADIEKTVQAVAEEAPAILASQHDKIRKRIADLDIEVDPARLEQELVILAQKSDVQEEIDRLVTHVGEVRRNLSIDEPVGRRLDFLMQELNREANTLSSKAQVSATTMHAVDLKVVIEQMREQIQNIE